jgi:hypothetical protein
MLDGRIDTDTAEPRLAKADTNSKRPLSKSTKSKKKPSKRKAKK